MIHHWWQTETGWPVCANCVGIELMPVKPGSVGRPVAGWDVAALTIGPARADRGDGIAGM